MCGKLFIILLLFCLQEIVVGSNMDKIYIVMDYVEHDLKSLMETLKSPFLVGEWQSFRAVWTVGAASAALTILQVYLFRCVYIS